MGSTHAGALADFIANADTSSLSAHGRLEVQRAVLDFLGVALRGSQDECGAIVQRFVIGNHAGEASTLIGNDRQVSPIGAALANGVAGHAHDFDDIGLGVGHPTAAMLPATLAAAEHVGADGAALLDAMVIGYEVASRFSRPFPGTVGPYDRGYHTTSIYGIFGAAAASARLMGLSSNEARAALGIAASQSAGLRANWGSMTKPFHAGQANAAGLTATMLAQDGFTASPASIEGALGWFDVIGGDRHAADQMLDGLGHDFAIERGLWFKQYPSCGANHLTIDAVIRLMQEHSVSADDIRELDVTVSTHVERILRYPWPTSGLEGKFSLPYNVAVAALEGYVPLEAFHNDQIDRYTGIRDRITVHYESDWPKQCARIELTTRDGSTHLIDHTVLHGTEADPLSWEELTEKFRRSCDGIIESAATERLEQQISVLGAVPDVRALLAALAIPSAIYAGSS